jgi:hypothetical protein
VGHPDGDASDAGPGIEPGAQRVKRARSYEGIEHPVKPSRCVLRELLARRQMPIEGLVRRNPDLPPWELGPAAGR